MSATKVPHRSTYADLGSCRLLSGDLVSRTYRWCKQVVGHEGRLLLPSAGFLGLLYMISVWLAVSRFLLRDVYPLPHMPLPSKRLSSQQQPKQTRKTVQRLFVFGV